MRLSEFIRHSTGEIVSHSVDFARTLEPLANQSIDIAVLRDHLPLVLEAIASDLDQPQSRTEGITRSEGRALSIAGETAAQIHGRLRAATGLSIAQVVAEYRVLRAVVIRLWSDARKVLVEKDIPDLVRFNEAIDQAIAESVTFHSTEVGRWRDMMLAVVSHDLRGPMQAVISTSEVLLSKATDLYAPYVGAITRSVDRLTGLLDSLLDYSKVRLGEGLPLTRRTVSVAAACESEVELLRAAHPVAIEFTAEGSCVGEFDASRIREALANLVSNAVQYRTPGTTVNVNVQGGADTVRVSVINEGDAIQPEELQMLFEPLRRRDQTPGNPARRNLGIGLFVVREIVRAHGGNVAAEASDGKVIFSMTLPKQARIVEDPIGTKND